MSLDLPMMKCDPNCGQCCGVVICQDEEFRAVVGYAKNHGIEPLKQGSTCPFYQNGQCTVYPVRPFVCRLFGHTPKLECPHGYNTNLPEGRVKKLDREYLRRGTPLRFLHEAAYSLDDMPEAVFGMRHTIRTQMKGLFSE